MSGVVASLWAMVVLGLMVSAVGVTNTLTINVLEQTRELGLLRIVAMTQNQVRKTIFTQAVIMALLALVPGIIAGVSVAYMINVAMMPVIGHPVQFAFHPALLLGGVCGRAGGRRVCRLVPRRSRGAARFARSTADAVAARRAWRRLKASAVTIACDLPLRGLCFDPSLQRLG